MSDQLTQLSLRHRITLSLILGAFLALGFGYSTAVPLFEKPDEPFHFFFVQQLLDEQTLPVMGESATELWAQEGSQPPLYYALAALALSWIDTSDAEELLWLNPQRNLGDPENPGNKNYIVHTEQENWPYQGAVLAIHVARWLSLLFGAGTVAITFLIVYQAFPDRPQLALGAAAITALIPQFLFISSSVSNDSLITFLSAWALFQMTRLLNRPSPGAAPYISLGIAVGLAALTKLSGLALLGPGCIVLAWLALRQRSWRPLLVGSLALFGLTAAIAGWWYLRNLRLYGDLSGLELHLVEMGGRRELPPLSLKFLWSELIGLRASFWGLFGWFSILMPTWVYRLFDVVTAFGVIGLIRFLRERDIRSEAGGRTIILALLWFAVVLISLLRWTTIVKGSQGRLLFPAIPGIALALAVGWSNLLTVPARGQRSDDTLIGAAAGLFVLSAAVLAWVIPPAYARPSQMEAADLPAELAILDLTYDTEIRLHGCQTDRDRLKPGDVLAITCYWEALRPMSEDYYLFHHVLGRDLEPVGKEDGYPGSGTFPTSLWPVGQVIAATEWVRIGEEAAAPVLGQVVVGVFDPDTRRDLTPVTPLGNSIRLAIAEQIKIAPPKNQEITIPNPVRFSVGDLALLTGYEINQEETLTVTLFWQVSAAPPHNQEFSVFVHLLD